MEQLAVGIMVAAEAIGVCRTHIYGLISAGEITKIKVGRRALITTDSLKTFIERATLRALEQRELASTAAGDLDRVAGAIDDAS